MTLDITTTTTITHRDGWGYRVGEGDVSEVIITYFQETAMGYEDRGTFSLFNGETGRAVLDAITKQFDKMDADDREA